MNSGSVFRLPRFSSVASIHGISTIGPQQTIPTMDGIPEEKSKDESILTRQIENKASILTNYDENDVLVPKNDAVPSQQSDVSQSDDNEGSIKIDMMANSDYNHD